MKNVNSKKIALLFLTGFVLTSSSCNKKSEIKSHFLEATLNPNLGYETEKVMRMIELKENIIKNGKEISIEISSISINKLDCFLNEFNNQLEEIKKNDIQNIQNTKDFIISSFISLMDFKYYGKEINGITYDELSDDVKEKISDILNHADTIIDSHFPDYKENISSRYKDIKEDITNFTYDKLGEENWNQIMDTKDNVKSTLDSTIESAKTKVKNWYEQFRNNY